jgi:hypothetical protein
MGTKHPAMITGIGILALSVGLFGGGLGWAASSKGAASSAASKNPSRDAALKAVKLDYTVFTAPDRVMKGTFTVENQSAHDVSAVKVRCKPVGENGVALPAKETTFNEVVKAKASKKFVQVSLGQVSGNPQSTSCNVVDLKAK